jgi:hypothetical protein
VVQRAKRTKAFGIVNVVERTKELGHLDVVELTKECSTSSLLYVGHF